MKNLYLGAVLLLFWACSSPGDQGPSQQASIQQRIETDLADGLSAVSQIQIDTTNLPKRKFTAEKNHSSIQFRTGHWEIVDLIGWVMDFDVVLYADEEDFSDAVIFAEVNPASIVMPNEKMAGSLQNREYLDVAQFPKASFSSTGIEIVGENRYKLLGEMTMKGHTISTLWDVTFNGYAYPGEKSICGFTARTSFNRMDIGIEDESRLHSGRLLHDPEIEIVCNLRME